MRLDQPMNGYLPGGAGPRPGLRPAGAGRPPDGPFPGFRGPGARASCSATTPGRPPARPLPARERPSASARRARSPSYSNYGAALAGERPWPLGSQTATPPRADDGGRPLAAGHAPHQLPRPHRRPAKAALPAPMPAELAADVARGLPLAGRFGFRRAPYEFIGQLAPAGSASSTAGDMAALHAGAAGDSSAG